MEKKIDHYVTDSLITSDEFDNFDHQLRLQLKELKQIDYDSQSINWKRNTLPFGFLWHVEKLLAKKGKTPDQSIENIKELQALLGKYANVKTFLLTLRIATIAYRAGLIPEFTTLGEAYRNQQQKRANKPRSRGGKSPAEIQTRNAQIIEHFKKALLEYPNITQSSFSKKHAAGYGLKPRQIRNILKIGVGS